MTHHLSPLDDARLSRRGVVGGAAWSVPAVAYASAAPAFAASVKEVVVTVKANKWNGVAQTITVPAGAWDVSFEVIGGGGGTYIADRQSAGYFAERGGSGARITGKLALGGVATPLWVVAGGAGYGTGDSGRDPVVATGFGNGGSSHSIPRNTLIFYWSQSWAMGGGAGSAIAVGSAPSSGGSLLVAAGGGGSAALSDHSRRQSTTYKYESMAGGNGGDAGGGTSPAFIVNHVTGSLTAPGGGGAQGAAGGAAGAPGTDTLSPRSELATRPGRAGGNNGTGNYGGGNGGEPAELATTVNGTHYLSTASAAGGGGYAGGGSGGIVHAAGDGVARSSSGSPVFTLVGANGGGGAGSNFIAAATTAGVTVSGTAVSQAGNGGTYATRVGGIGSVTIRYWMPA